MFDVEGAEVGEGLFGAGAWVVAAAGAEDGEGLFGAGA